jgi:hypothetical protein
MRYQVEIKGQGVKPYTFNTRQEAEDYAITMTAWQGGSYRLLMRQG